MPVGPLSVGYQKKAYAAAATAKATKTFYKDDIIGIAYSGNALDWLYLQYSLQIFLAFCLVSSAVYLANDIIDRKRDRLHPQKKYRPIASGKLSPELASGIALGLAVAFLAVAFAFF